MAPIFLAFPVVLSSLFTLNKAAGESQLNLRDLMPEETLSVLGYTLYTMQGCPMALSVAGSEVGV